MKDKIHNVIFKRLRIHKLTAIHLTMTLELEWRLRARPSHPISVCDLTNALLEEWSKIPINTPKPGGKLLLMCELQESAGV